MLALWTKRSIVHALVFVRLAHERRFVGVVLFVLVRFVFIRISGRHCVAHDHEGTPVDQPGGKFLGDVWGHVVAPRAWKISQGARQQAPKDWRQVAARRASARSALPTLSRHSRARFGRPLTDVPGN